MRIKCYTRRLRRDIIRVSNNITYISGDKCVLFGRTFEIIERRSRIVSDLGDNNFAGKL